MKLSKFWEDKHFEVKYDTDNIFAAQYLTALKDRVIILNDRIDDDAIETITMPLWAMDSDGSGKTITLLLNTSGGFIGSGFSIVDILEKMKTPTNIHIIGEAFSMGLYIAMAGHNNPYVKTTCTPFARGMYHNSLLSEYCDDEEIKSFQARYDDTVIADYIVTHSNITYEDLRNWKGKEIYFTAKELEKLGIAEIV